jgi:hypothetical protein
MLLCRWCCGCLLEGWGCREKTYKNRSTDTVVSHHDRIRVRGNTSLYGFDEHVVDRYMSTRRDDLPQATKKDASPSPPLNSVELLLGPT